MKSGEKYWTVYHNEKTKFVQLLEATWNGGMVDQKRESEERIFKTRKEAERYKESL